MKRASIPVLLFCALTARAQAADFTPTPLEAPPAGETEQIGQIVDLTVQLLQYRYGDSLARRGVHAKDHGCVKGTLAVDADIPEALRAGVFAAPGKSYEAWVRFSNATGIVTADYDTTHDTNTGATTHTATSRGMAIKLIGVEGATLFDEPGAKTQDFLLINQPMFGFGDVATYLKVTQLQLQFKDNNTALFGVLFGKIPHPTIAPMSPPDIAKTAAILARIGGDKMSNPLDGPYFSASPFLYGNGHAAKFSVTRRDPENRPIDDFPSDNALRQAMKHSLSITDGKPVVYDFSVQLRPDGLSPGDAAFPIEDAAFEWKETAAASYRKVATLTISPQDFDNPLRITECEHLVFTPWHGLIEHQPLGGINRLRRAVYITSSQYRAQPREPSKFPVDYPK